MKKVIIISYEFPPILGGAGTVAENIAIGLSDRGYQVKLYTSKSKIRNKNYKFSIYSIFSIPVFFPVQFVKVLFSKSIKEADVILINDIGAALVASYFFSKKLKLKTIVYLHGSEPEKILQKGKFLFKLIAFRYFYIKLLKECKKIIVVSDYMKYKLLGSLTNENIKEKLIIVYSGVNEKLFYEEEIDLHSIYGINKNAILLLSASRVEEGKGYYKKYNIFKQLLANEENIHWLIAGTGSYLEKLTRIVSDEQMSNKITFLGALDKDELRKYYSSVDLFWLLSEMEESFGLVYVEAAFCGVPSIGMNNAGVKEAIIVNKTGFLVKNDAECYNLIDNKIYKKLSKQQIKESARIYSLKTMIDKIEKVIV